MKDGVTCLYSSMIFEISSSTCLYKIRSFLYKIQGKIKNSYRKFLGYMELETCYYNHTPNIQFQNIFFYELIIYIFNCYMGSQSQKGILNVLSNYLPNTNCAKFKEQTSNYLNVLNCTYFAQKCWLSGFTWNSRYWWKEVGIKEVAELYPSIFEHIVVI